MEIEMPSVTFTELSGFFPKQREALEATKKFKYTLFGGSVGSGKSRWIRWTCVYWLLDYYSRYKIKGVRAGLFCEDYPSLNDRHLTKIKYEFPSWLGTYNESKKEFTLSDGYGGGIIAFRNLDDPSKYLSVEFAVIAIDEVNRNPKATFDMLRSRHRWPGITDVKFFAGCNPLGEAWVKNMWVKRMFPPDEKEQYEFVFIQALPTDNPHLSQDYYKSLESLPEVQRKAYLEGNWDAFDEQMDEKGYIRLISDKQLQEAYTYSNQHSGARILGIDPAAGGDKSAIVLKSGTCQEVLYNKRLENTMDFVSIIMGFYHDKSIHFMVVDKTGVGQGVYDRLRSMDYPVRGISFGEKPENEMFQNVKAELHWKQRLWVLNGGKLYHDPGWSEFEIVKYRNKDGKIMMQPKEELFKEGIQSPNVVDAAVLSQAISDHAALNRNVKIQGFTDKTIEIWRN